ncbi:uncharacterized protein [Ptychodera flava]|uniref:uncharacterized protein n=1 Tax=Ptychodera flava TaxID=63121 RepID=UPI00396A9959
MAPRKQPRRSSNKKNKKHGRNENKRTAKTAAQIYKMKDPHVFEKHVYEQSEVAFPDYKVNKQVTIGKVRVDIKMDNRKKKQTIIIETKYYKSDLGKEEVDQVIDYIEQAKAVGGIMVVLKDTNIDEGNEKLMKKSRIKLVRANYHLRANLKKAEADLTEE